MLQNNQLVGFGATFSVSGAIGTPVGIGSLNKSSSSSTTATYTTTADILAGDLLVLADSSLTTGNITSVTVGVDSLTLGKRQQNGSGLLEVWYKENATAQASGVTVTITYSVATVYAISAIARVPSAATSSSLDQTVGGNSVPITTATLTYPNEVVFGAVGGFNITACTEDGAFTNLYFLTNASQVAMNIGYKSVSATTAVSYNPTITGSGSPAYAALSFH